MGVSTDAVLFYGYCWDEEGELIGGRWEDRVLLARGHVNPWDAYSATGIEGIRDTTERLRLGKEWCDRNRADIDRWHELRRAVREELGCDIGSHCSGDCPMPYVYVESSDVTVRRGHPWAFRPEELVKLGDLGFTTGGVPVGHRDREAGRTGTAAVVVGELLG